jgi:putative transposase
MCTYRKEMYLGDSGLVKIVQQVWDTIPQHHPTVRTDEFVVMPNHVHGILWLLDVRRGRMHPAPDQGTMHASTTLGGIYPAPTKIKRASLHIVVQNFKAEVTRQIRRTTQIYFAWQRNYYEHVIRNEDELNRIRQYIRDNPLNWETDEENPNRKTMLVPSIPF